MSPPEYKIRLSNGVEPQVFMTTEQYHRFYEDLLDKARPALDEHRRARLRSIEAAINHFIWD